MSIRLHTPAPEFIDCRAQLDFALRFVANSKQDASLPCDKHTMEPIPLRANELYQWATLLKQVNRLAIMVVNALSQHLQQWSIDLGDGLHVQSKRHGK